jgi:hypothetical protein
MELVPGSIVVVRNVHPQKQGTTAYGKSEKGKADGGTYDQKHRQEGTGQTSRIGRLRPQRVLQHTRGIAPNGFV